MTNITYGTFLFFGSSLVVGIIVVWVFMPETKGLALEDMDIMFNLGGLAHSKRIRTDEIIAEKRAQEGLSGLPEKEVSEEHVEGA